MCQLCDDQMKRIRALLASKVVGLLPKEDDTDLEPAIDRVLGEHARMVGLVDTDASRQICDCAAARERLAAGIRKTLPTISFEDRLQLALAAGAVRFHP